MLNWCGYNWECKMEGGRKMHPDTPWMWYCQDMAVVDKNGTLHLKIENRPTEIKYLNGIVYHPKMATGVVRSVKSFGYGTFSAEIRMPDGKNLWPSFWLTGDKHWPPEIDVVEGWSEDGDYFHWTIPQFPWLCPSWKTTTNVHYNSVSDGNLINSEIGSRNVSILDQKLDPSKNFLEYKCEWYPDSIKFYIGGKLVRSVGKKVSRMLTQNIPGDGKFDMDVVLNLWCDNPDDVEVTTDSEMLVKNFKYTPYSK